MNQRDEKFDEILKRLKNLEGRIFGVENYLSQLHSHLFNQQANNPAANQQTRPPAMHKTQPPAEKEVDYSSYARPTEQNISQQSPDSNPQNENDSAAQPAVQTIENAPQNSHAIEAETTPPPIPETYEPAPPKSSLEQKIGQKLLLIAGIIIMLTGGAFFLKFAYDKNLIAPPMRCLLALICSLVTIGIGELARAKKKLFFAAGLYSAGVIGLYFTAWSASPNGPYFPAFKILTQQYAFAAMCATTAIAIFLAHRSNQIFGGILAAIGAFATPTILSSGQNSQAILLGYMLLVNVAFFGLAYFKRWFALVPISMLGTVAIFTGWSLQYYSHPETSSLLAYSISSCYTALAFGYLLIAKKREIISSIAGELIALLAIILATVYLSAVKIESYSNFIFFLFGAISVTLAFAWHARLRVLPFASLLLLAGMIFVPIAQGFTFFPEHDPAGFYVAFIVFALTTLAYYIFCGAGFSCKSISKKWSQLILAFAHFMVIIFCFLAHKNYCEFALPAIAASTAILFAQSMIYKLSYLKLLLTLTTWPAFFILNFEILDIKSISENAGKITPQFIYYLVILGGIYLLSASDLILSAKRNAKPGAWNFLTHIALGILGFATLTFTWAMQTSLASFECIWGGFAIANIALAWEFDQLSHRESSKNGAKISIVLATLSLLGTVLYHFHETPTNMIIALCCFAIIAFMLSRFFYHSLLTNLGVSTLTIIGFATMSYQLKDSFAENTLSIIFLSHPVMLPLFSALIMGLTLLIGLSILRFYKSPLEQFSLRNYTWLLGLLLGILTLPATAKLMSCDNSFFVWSVAITWLIILAAPAKDKPMRAFTFIAIATLTLRWVTIDMLDKYAKTGPLLSYRPILNIDMLKTILLSGIVYATGYLIKRRDKKSKIASLFLLIPTAVILLAGVLEIIRVVKQNSDWLSDPELATQMGLSLWFGIYAAVLLTIGFIRKYAPLRYISLVIFAGTIAKVFLVDMSDVEAAYRILSFVGVGVLLISASWLYHKYFKAMMQQKQTPLPDAKSEGK